MRVSRWLCGAIAAASLLGACTDDPATSSTPGAPTTATASAPATTLTPPVSVAPTTVEPSAADPAEPSPVASDTATSVDTPAASNPGPVAPSVQRRTGLGAITFPGVKLTTSRGSANLDKVGVAGYYLQVCATGETQVALGLDQFTLTSLDAHQVMPLLTSGGYQPVLKPATIPGGSCAEGYLSFDLSQAQSDAYLLSWQSDSVKAVWSFNG